MCVYSTWHGSRDLFRGLDEKVVHEESACSRPQRVFRR